MREDLFGKRHFGKGPNFWIISGWALEPFAAVGAASTATGTVSVKRCKVHFIPIRYMNVNSLLGRTARDRVCDSSARAMFPCTKRRFGAVSRLAYLIHWWVSWLCQSCQRTNLYFIACVVFRCRRFRSVVMSWIKTSRVLVKFRDRSIMILLLHFERSEWRGWIKFYDPAWAKWNRYMGNKDPKAFTEYLIVYLNEKI